MMIPPTIRRWIRPIAIAVGVIVLGWFLGQELRHYSYREIIHAWRSIPMTTLFVGGFLTVVSYALLIGYDGLALKHLGRKVGKARTAFAGFTAFVLTNNVGLGGLCSSAVRLRLYGAWGLTATEVLTMQAFVGATFWLGLTTTAGAAWLITGGSFDFTGGRIIGGLLLAAGPAYVALCAFWTKPFVIWRWTFALPRPRLALAQLLLGAADTAVAGTVLWVLLPTGYGTWGEFQALYAGALAIAVISTVPGGLGVLESIVLLGRPDHLPVTQAVAGLVAFRAIYYLAPLAFASLGLAVFELNRHRAKVSAWATSAGHWLPAVAPRVLALATFMAGVMLLVSGATPPVHGRMAWLNDLLPLPIIETSHLLGSVAGIALLLLARGLQRRLDAAYLLTLLMLSTGVCASLLKGFDWEEALTLGIMLAALAPCRSFFDRRSTLSAERFTPGWIIAIGLVIGGATWLGLFAYQHVEYRQTLWWRFSPHADAPRFMRAQLVAIIGLVAFGLYRLLRISASERSPSTPVASANLEALVAASPHTSSQLALLGDKEIILSLSGNGFVMFARSGRSWIALGDPVTPDADERSELIWALRERAQRAGGRAVFYEIHKENLAQYLDAGFGLTKVGEEARVPLTGFSLAGRDRRGLRATVNKLEREGSTFEWVDRADVAKIMPDLRRISDSWLASKSAREKGFSLGFFAETYLLRNPVGIVRREGQIVAFANVWSGANKAELSIDLMRYDEAAPSGVMEYLFVKLMLKGAAEGYQWFSLGIAPLAGMETHELAPLTHRIGSLIFRHADHFYGFQGLRSYKDKFDPVWEPRYVAVAGVWQLPLALTDIATLVSGGLKGVFMK